MLTDSDGQHRRWPMYLVSAALVAMTGKTTVTTDDAAAELRLIRGDIQNIAVQVGVLKEKVRNLEDSTNGSE